MNKTVDDAIRSSFLAFAIKSFAQLYAGKELVVHEYVEFLAWHLDAVVTGKRRRLVVSLPPRHLKTFLASIWLRFAIYGLQRVADETTESPPAVTRKVTSCKYIKRSALQPDICT